MAMGQGRDGDRELVKRTVQNVERILPTTEMSDLEAHINALPREHQGLVTEYMRHGWGVIEKAAAATLASIVVQQEEQANSGVTLWPIDPRTGAPFAAGATVPPGLVCPLQPVTSGASSGPYNFVEQQRFFGLLTHSMDSTAGWCFAAGSVKLATDAISGLNYGDTSFALFEQDVVAGRMITGEYERHGVIEEIEFFASAILRNAAPQPMLVGVNLQFWDWRCKNALSVRKWNYWDDDFSGLVRDVVLTMHGGALSRRLESMRLRSFR